MELHKLLTRQLNRLELNDDTLPPTPEKWKAFLNRINTTYIEGDQERYLNARSINISSRELLELNQKLINTARQAGMADIATSILHNVGNILNSANVSIGLLKDTTEEPYFKRLVAILKMLKEHQNTLITYLTEDPKGQLIPEYLIEILDVLKTEDTIYIQEITNLDTHLQHIREIVAMQQAFSGISGIIEKIFLPEVIDIALQISGYTLFPDKHIQVIKIYKQTPFIMTDQTKLLQILVNLIRNAKEAITENNQNAQKEIILLIDYGQSNNEIIIKVIDHGIGIPQENLIRIFSFGFTTKPKGRGVGLNSCAIAAKELGGTLIAESEGIGKGATFTLKIPVSYTKPKRKTHDPAN